MTVETHHRSHGTNNEDGGTACYGGPGSASDCSVGITVAQMMSGVLDFTFCGDTVGVGDCCDVHVRMDDAESARFRAWYENARADEVR